MKAVEALALVGEHVDEKLLIRNEYLAAENRILKAKLPKPVQFNDGERIQLAKIGKRMGLKALKEISYIVKPETIKSECISGLIFFGETSLLKALKENTIHYHEERNPQGKENKLLFLIYFFVK
jgi:hypothetical protein